MARRNAQRCNSNCRPLHVILPPWLMYNEMESFWRSWIFAKRSCCSPTLFSGRMMGLLLGRTSKREPKMRSAWGTTPCASARSRVRLTATSMPAYSVEQWTSCGLKKSGIWSRSTLWDWKESRSYQSKSSCSIGHSRVWIGKTSKGCQRNFVTSTKPVALKRFTAISMRSLTQTGVMFCVAATRVSSPWKRQISLWIQKLRGLPLPYVSNLNAHWYGSRGSSSCAAWPGTL
mmetsp:Transcript_4593/g.13039  ORF Transcript_4593/g.13039 Transcript_4593/m.13039 type:complete len:231 (-) Transcript_4593:703-1395(-)